MMYLDAEEVLEINELSVHECARCRIYHCPGGCLLVRLGLFPGDAMRWSWLALQMARVHILDSSECHPSITFHHRYFEVENLMLGLRTVDTPSDIPPYRHCSVTIALFGNLRVDVGAEECACLNGVQLGGTLCAAGIVQ